MKNKIHIVTLPDIGEGVVEGEVIEWLKQVGDIIGKDEPVVTVMTDKATVELPSPCPGKLARQYHQAGEIACIDKPLYDIELSEEIATEIPEEKEVAPPPLKPSLPSPELVPAPSSPTRAPSSGKKSLATPHVRKLATDLGVDISLVPASGKDGRVTASDIKTFLAGQQTTSSTPIPRFEGDEVKPLQGIRKLVAQKMTESKTMIPHFTFFDTANAKYLVQLKENLKGEAQKRGLKLTYTPFFIRALSHCLKEYPQFNASLDLANSALVYHKPHNIGVAMKSQQGLIVPVLEHVEGMSLEDIVRSLADIKERAKTNKLLPKEMKSSTITLSNFGTEGGLWATPVINYPEVAILATAKIYKTPMVKNDQIVIQDALNCSWSFDHRFIDGDVAAAFSKAFISLIENPGRLL